MFHPGSDRAASLARSASAFSCGQLLPLLLLCVALWLPSKARAGPWTRSAGEWYAKLGSSLYLADGFRDSSGRLVEGVSYLGLSNSLYAEVGMLDGLMAIVYLPHLSAVNELDNGEQYARLSLADTNLALQWNPDLLPLAHALRLEGKLPLYDIAPPRGLDGINFPAAGDGQLDLTGWVSLGDGLQSLPGFYLVEFGYQWRSDSYLISEAPSGAPNFADSGRFFAQLGYRLLEDKYLMLSSTGVWPLARDAYTKGWINVGLGVFWPVGHGVALELAIDQAVHVRNSAQGSGVSIGVSHSR